MLTHSLIPDATVLAILLAVADTVLAKRKRRKHTRRDFV